MIGVGKIDIQCAHPGAEDGYLKNHRGMSPGVRRSATVPGFSGSRKPARRG
ncbi:hypothetical protein HMPREF0290_2528 [Corynebacterium efficiens YS-314]|nr:hypothetical protein HMPREF0290_2528 [Corynebacterium efficiens YS-314]